MKKRVTYSPANTVNMYLCLTCEFVYEGNIFINAMLGKKIQIFLNLIGCKERKNAD